MQKLFDEENKKFGVTKGEALERTRDMLSKETNKINSVTHKLKSYMNDL